MDRCVCPNNGGPMEVVEIKEVVLGDNSGMKVLIEGMIEDG